MSNNKYAIMFLALVWVTVIVWAASSVYKNINDNAMNLNFKTMQDFGNADR